MERLESKLTDTSAMDEFRTVQPRPPPLDAKKHKMIKYGGTLRA